MAPQPKGAMPVQIDHEANRDFEAEVRRAAEAVWGLEPGQCQPEYYSAGKTVRELDGLARLRDVTHVIMVTTSRRLDKVKQDVVKLQAAKRIEEEPARPVAMWLITSEQLEAEHVRYARDKGVTVLTLSQFRNRFFSGRDYLERRRAAPFGSARNLEDGTGTISEDEYVELPMQVGVVEGREPVSLGKFAEIRLEGIEAGLRDGEVFVMMAPFGAGKSLTLRQIFLALMRANLKGHVDQTPVAINLREHWGAEFGDEILERHARSIGFSPRESLTAACRAGMVTLLIDGFDEVASQTVVAPERVDFMREARLHALQGIRDLIGALPSSSGVLICGRDHYFDNIGEMIHALGLHGRRFGVVRLGEFTEEQATEFLRKRGIGRPLPDWLPRKPLLLAYLAHQELLERSVAIDSSQGFGFAWDEFLRLICEREATQRSSTMDPQTIRRVLERLACDVRATVSGAGPLTGRELAEAYRLETGQFPGEGVLMQLQRLPGMTERGHGEGARSFVDEDLLSALQGSAVARVLLGDLKGVLGRGWLSELGAKGVAMACYRLQRHRASVDTVLGMIRQVGGGRRDAGEVGESQLAADGIMIALELMREGGQANCGGIELEGVHLGTLDCEDVRIDGLEVRESVVREVILGPTALDATLRLRKCLIERVGGVAAREALPARMFIECEVETVDEMATNSAVIRSALPDPMKALVTILRKLYLQPGAGRKRGALKRGIPNGRVLDAVDEVLRILEGEGLVTLGGEAVHPVRRQTARAMQILNAPALSRDSIVDRVRRI